MAFKLVVLSLMICLDTIRTTEVELIRKWKPESGWEVECSWTLFPNDSLQSVRLYNNERQFMIYRPERDGQHSRKDFPLQGTSLLVGCTETADKGRLGACVLNLELYEPPTEAFNVSCEVSGEGPMFRVDKKDISIENYVPPSDASVHVVTLAGSEQLPGRVALNCTTSGLPVPNLQWTIGTQKVPHDFNGSMWNVKTKLWDVWSLLSYSATSERLDAICQPEAITNGYRVTGKAAVYNRADALYGAAISLSIVSLLLILLGQT